MTDCDPTRRPGGTMRDFVRRLRDEVALLCLVPGCWRPCSREVRGVCARHRRAEVEAILGWGLAPGETARYLTRREVRRLERSGRLRVAGRGEVGR